MMALKRCFERGYKQLPYICKLYIRCSNGWTYDNFSALLYVHLRKIVQISLMRFPSASPFLSCLFLFEFLRFPRIAASPALIVFRLEPVVRLPCVTFWADWFIYCHVTSMRFSRGWNCLHTWTSGSLTLLNRISFDISSSGCNAPSKIWWVSSFSSV